MLRLKYLIPRLLHLDYKWMFETIGNVHRKTNLSRVWIFKDVVNCGLKYGAGYRDYELCEFYNLNEEQRSTYVTRGINNRIVQLLNNWEFAHIFENKVEFNEKFNAFVRRPWVDMNTASFEDFKRFMDNETVVISKPLDGSCGKGIEKIEKSDYPDLNVLFEYLKSSGSGIVERCVVQHEDVSKIYPYSVNTYRIVTVLTDGEAHVVYAFIRIGNGGRFVDNINSGGMAAPIDLETGKIQYPAFDKDSKYYEEHPMTGTKLVGYQLPCFDEAMKMCLEAAKVVPEIGYVGWDICVSEDGPLLIEGNPYPGHDILQMPPHVPDKIGMLPRFKSFIKEL